MLWKVYNDKTNEFHTVGFDHVIGSQSFWGWDFIYKEIFDWEYSDSKCVYEMWDCTLQPNDVVVDLGASVGFFAHKASGIASKVIAIDGSPENFSCLVQNTKDLPNVLCANVCVTGSSNETPYLWSQKGNPLTISISDIFKIFDLEKIDFLKCDIEGGEYDLFNSIDPDVLKKIDRIAIETHDPIRNEDFFLPGKIRHSFFWDYGSGSQTTMYFVTPK